MSYSSKVAVRRCLLAANYPDSVDTDLASYIPSAIEKLSLRFSRSLPFLHDINDWIKHTSDGTWLPHLKSFQLIVDPKAVSEAWKYVSLYFVPLVRAPLVTTKYWPCRFEKRRKGGHH
jgi:hypothetical protein